MDDMDIDLEIENTIFIRYAFKFSICRLLDNVLVPSNISVTAEINIIDDDHVESMLRKINYWIDEYVMGSIAIPATELGLSLVLNEKNTPRLQNHLMITPGIPTDEHLCILFQSKLDALAAGAFKIGMIEVTSDNSEGLIFSFIGNHEEVLPTMEEWIVGQTWFDLPWWERDDSSTIDTLAPPDSDLSVKPAWAVDLSFITRQNDMSEAIIMRGDFQPRIVDKKDD